MMMASRLGWPNREWGLDHMDAIEFADWILYLTNPNEDWRSPEQIHADQIAGFRALRQATK